MIGWYEDTIDREANLPIRSCLFQRVRNLGRMETAHSQASLFEYNQSMYIDTKK
jgi:hypothetical protein